jgi:hypothetical protein
MQIKVDCPQCGGDIVFDEEIEVVRCAYCGATNRISGKTNLPRFMLPPRWTMEACHQRFSTLLSRKKSPRLETKRLQLAYAPYWRTKGMVFHWALGKRHAVSKEGARSWDDAKELKTRNFDLSFPAYKQPDLGLQTLGIRTAALPLQLFHRSRLEGKEIVLPAEVSLQEAIQHSNGFLTLGFSDRSLKVELEDTQLIGEVYSIVYFPFWVLEVGTNEKSGILIIDAVANRIKRTIWDQDLTSFFENGPSAAPPANFGNLQLTPFTCPVCGWDLPFSPESRTHICPTCARAWAEEHGNYKEMDYQLVAVPGNLDQAIRYLPFWDLEIQIHTPHEVLKTRADLSKLAPGLRVGSAGRNGADTIRFLIPAFKIKDIKSLSKLATLFCSSPPQQNFRAKERLEKEKIEGVCLAGAEAEEMARVVLISMVPRYHRRARKLLKDTRIQAGLPKLVYYPFYRKGLYLREVNSNHSIQHGTVCLSSDS